MAFNPMDILKVLGIGGGLGSAAMGAYDAFGRKGNNPADSAMPYLNQIPGTISPYYQPYIQSGLQVNPQLQSFYQGLISNPTGALDAIGKGYKESPGYQTKLNRAMGAITNAQAAGGMLGTPQHQDYAGQKAAELSDEDYYNYINHALGLLGMGTSGAENIATRGFQASTGLGENLASNLAQQANYAYAGKAGQNQQRAQGWQNIIGGLASMLPWLGNDKGASK